jgi:hypothetical protein
MEVSGQLYALVALFMGEDPPPPTPIHWTEAWVASELGRTLWRREKSFIPAANSTLAAQPARVLKGIDWLPINILYDLKLLLMMKSYPRNRPWRPIGLWNVGDPTLSRQSAHRWRQGCQPSALSSIHQKHYFSVSGAHSSLLQLEGLGRLKNSFTSSGLKPTTFRLVA